ncbi:DNA primase [Georgenia sp. TF02-10]|uniref:DNA primase n=1 Tax=Georgenia sp. TF02-10 TaxID=2917725 RepID=UPI001FA7B59A|nr:DNA primase [Georgenia sp. TF02-10]UNX56127.1 DNA primase [Georgenia sp. TF02-10]
MATDPRAALDRLIAAFEAHYDAVAAAQDSDAPAVLAAASTLMDAFDTYDDALFTGFGVDTPFDIYTEDDEDEDDDDLFEDDEDEDGDDEDGDGYEDDEDDEIR